MVSPSSKFTIRYEVDFDHPLVSSKPVKLEMQPEQFANYCATARTFGFKRDVDAMRQRGLALGGSLENAVVIDDYEILNPDGLRFADEFVRHKILDAVGDMALIGMPIVADISMSRSGHALNAKLVEEILSSELNYDVVVSRASGANSTESLSLWVQRSGFPNRSDLGLIPRREAPVTAASLFIHFVKFAFRDTVDYDTAADIH